jgi:hypothetical protein
MLEMVNRGRGIAVVFAVVAAILLASAPADAGTRTVPQGFFGVNSSGAIESSSSTVQVMQWNRLASAGAESVRILFNWDIAQHNKAVTDWSLNDFLITQATQRGMKILPVVEYAPRWAKRYPDQVSSPPRGTAAYSAFLRKAIQRYGPNGDFWKLNKALPYRPLREWQIWNEPEIAFHWYRKPFTRKWEPSDAHDYVTLLKAAYKAVHSADPGAKVVMAALSIDSWRSLGKLYRWGKLAKTFDVAALQGYAGKPSFIPTLVHRFRDVLDQHGRKSVPLYVTEMTWPAAKGSAHPKYTTGYMSGFLTDQQGAAQRLTQGYKLLSAKDLRKTTKLQRVFWYIGATPYTGRNEFDYSGLLRIAGGSLKPTPAYTAYQRAARAAEGCAKTSSGVCR